MDWLFEPFSSALLQRALLVGIMAAITTSVVGTWVVLRGMAFLGDALAHGILPGVAGALILGFNPLVGGAIAAGVMIASISWIHRSSKLSEDTAIGLLFVGMLAVGMILVSKSDTLAVNPIAILFGSILGVTPRDVVVQAIALVVTLSLVVVFYRPLLVLAFNEEKAHVLGLSPRRTHFVMMALVTIAVVATFDMVGSLLVFGLLIAPPATAALIARRVPVMMMLSSAIASLCVFAGLVISYYAGTAGGATIAALAVGVFFVTLAARNLQGLRPEATISRSGVQ
ncbi:Zinc ABC transporter, permease protein ZnuB [hydrothermal vent metagenome]|uniref:Zinc ABC transporter, permease protein ZnuB n=1 Tax=hydrothermal vent metagenome TaxID=652676 RepID=A0A3B0RT67_9ZZZZ